MQYIVEIFFSSQKIIKLETGELNFSSPFIFYAVLLKALKFSALLSSLLTIGKEIILIPAKLTPDMWKYYINIETIKTYQVQIIVMFNVSHFNLLMTKIAVTTPTVI